MTHAEGEQTSTTAQQWNEIRDALPHDASFAAYQSLRSHMEREDDYTEDEE